MEVLPTLQQVRTFGQRFKRALPYHKCCVVREQHKSLPLGSRRPEQADSVFTWADFADKNNNELLKNLGNLVQRALSFAYSSFEGTVPAPSALLAARDVEFITSINSLLKV